MSMKRILAGMMLVCGMASTSQAASLLASDPAFGGPASNRVICMITNSGSTNITFLQTMIRSQFINPLQLSFNDCVGVQRPGGICSFQAAVIDKRPALACQAVIEEAKTNVRGTLEILSPTNTVLSEVPIR